MAVGAHGKDVDAVGIVRFHKSIPAAIDNWVTPDRDAMVDDIPIIMSI